MKIKEALTICIISVLSLLSFQNIHAQNMGRITFEIKPINTLIKINNETYDYKEIDHLDLEEGEYIIQLWSPKFQVYTDTINVIATKNIVYAKGLSLLDPDFITYRKANNKHIKQKVITAIPATVLVGLTLPVLNYHRSKRQALKEIRRIAAFTADAHSRSVLIDDINFNRSEYEILESKYLSETKRYNRNVLITSTTAIIGYGLGALFYIKKIKKSKTEKPSYKNKAPFTNVIYQIQPSIYMPEQDQVAMGFNITF